MSKEKGCKCCKQIWYEDMLDKKWKLCPNCYEYCKPLIDNLNIKDKQIAGLQHRLKVAENALNEMANDWCLMNNPNKPSDVVKKYKEEAEKEVKGE